MPAKHSVAEKLCLTCGLCCNGVIFADVQLQNGDDDDRLEALGLPLRKLPKRERAQNSSTNGEGAFLQKKFNQPCPAFDGCRCRIYPERPKYCRAFDCALLKSVNLGEVTPGDALYVIEMARRRAEKVRQVLRRLGDKDEQMALSLRLRRTTKRIQQNEVDPPTGQLFSQLTLAVQDLNFLLSENFYPGATED